MYKSIEQKEAERIIDIIETAYLDEPINIQVGTFTLDATQVSQTEEYWYGDDMRIVHLMSDEDGLNVLQYKGKKYNASISVGEWGYENRLKGVHIVLAAGKLGSYFFQLELSQAVKDENYIYIIKNITKMAGRGAISRLYSGLKSDRAKKEARQQLFLNRLNRQVIFYDNCEWVVISKLKLNELYNQDAKNDIFHSLIYDIYSAALLVEDVVRINK